LKGTLRVPGDKSITHRGLLFAALAGGESRITAVNPGRDCAAMARALGELGAGIEKVGEWPAPSSAKKPSPPMSGTPGYVVRGVGGEWREPGGVLDLENSGTALRLLAGALAGGDGFFLLDGDASLRRRPMKRITAPLSEMGAHIGGRARASRPPLAITGTELTGIRHTSAVASAQVKSAILLAGLGARGETWVTEPFLSRDHTERLLPHFGGQINGPRFGGGGRSEVGVIGGQQLNAADLAVPGDFSSAAFWVVAATVVPGSEIILEGVGLNPTRTGLLPVLDRMGARIEVHREEDNGEPRGRIRVHTGDLSGTLIEAHEVPGMVDEIPIWAIAAACAEGESVVRGAADLRAKESDRLAAIRQMLGVLGVEVEEREDGLVIRGIGPLERSGRRLTGGVVRSAGDHRIAMASLVAGLIAAEPVQVTAGEMVDTSYPGFYSTLMSLVSSP
jgi:3-phosphoshikimate 1-carboxyvinyltransferase